MPATLWTSVSIASETKVLLYRYHRFEYPPEKNCTSASQYSLELCREFVTGEGLLFIVIADHVTYTLTDAPAVWCLLQAADIE